MERARQSIITGVFINMNFPNGSIMDVGCGEGTISADNVVGAGLGFGEPSSTLMLSRAKSLFTAPPPTL